MSATLQTAFPASVFERRSPAHLQQCHWADDSTFTDRLIASWRAQYADYLGRDRADALVDALLVRGDLFDHDPALTLVAATPGEGESAEQGVSERIGIGALRPAGDHCLITLLEVVDSCRGGGIGRQLVDAFIACSVPLIVHVSVHRPGIRHFYHGLGFQLHDRMPIDHYGHDLPFDVMFRL